MSCTLAPPSGAWGIEGRYLKFSAMTTCPFSFLAASTQLPVVMATARILSSSDTAGVEDDTATTSRGEGRR